jgi:Flp pilus assembly pilin Flp
VACGLLNGPGMHPLKQRTVGRRRLTADERGALAIEYVVITMVGLMVTAALLGLGVSMVNGYTLGIKALYTEHP